MNKCPKCGYDYFDGCDASCDYKHPMQEWVDVKENLPDPAEYVLLYDKSLDLVYEGKLRWDGFYYSDRAGFSKDLGEDCEITHWMPLPKPPGAVFKVVAEMKITKELSDKGYQPPKILGSM